MVAHTAKIAVPHCSDVRPVLHTAVLRASRKKDQVRLMYSYIHQNMFLILKLRAVKQICSALTTFMHCTMYLFLPARRTTVLIFQFTL